MKKTIARAGFLLLATVLCSFSSFAYDIIYDATGEASSNTNLVKINFREESIAPEGLICDFSICDEAGETIIYLLNFKIGDSISLNLEFGNYSMTVGGLVIDEFDFTVFEQGTGTDLTIVYYDYDYFGPSKILSTYH